MEPFLKQVASHYAAADGLDSLCLIFPNRRSGIFFSKYLREELLSHISKPVLLPQIITESDFFSAIYGRQASDKVSLILELYPVYQGLSPVSESLDDFLFWGDVILGDFSDADKYLVDPKQLFTNVADLKSIQDSFSYLSEEQRSAINSFLAHFRDGREYKNRFLGLWNILLPLYEGFRRRLDSAGMAYDGMIYRRVSELFSNTPAADILKEKFPRAGRFVFVGLNALNECEKNVLRKMRDARLADFCWDYCGEMIRDRHNRSSLFMERNISDFPMSWQLESVPKAPGEVNVVSVPSPVGQAKLLSEIIEVPEKTAVVLPDEKLLQPVLNSLPPEIDKINVTMGMPLTGSRFHALMNEVIGLQLHTREIRGGQYFYHKQVWGILTGGLLHRLFTQEQKEKIAGLKKEAKYYIPAEDFVQLGEIANVIFQPLNLELKDTSAAQVGSFGRYLLKVIEVTASKMTGSVHLAGEAEFAMRWYNCTEKLLEKNLEVRPATFARLLQHALSLQSVAFEGEPIGGLQIMGPLETRALDFENVVILSCNEGVFPRRSVSASFIPPALRTAFGMPTYEFQDAIWAYYFYRMISRCSKLWLLYDSRTEAGQAGEESRYIKQLEYHFRLPLRRMAAGMDLKVNDEPSFIPKPDNIRERLKEINLSSSALLNYLSCQAKFYYGTIEKLYPEGEVFESLDAGMIGNVFHETMQALYSEPGGTAPLKIITASYIDSLLSEKGRTRIRTTVEEKIKKALSSPVVSGRNLVFADIIETYVTRTLEVDKKLAPIEILGLEIKKFWEFEGLRFKGVIDRLDRVQGKIRVVDYKTGRDNPSDVAVEDASKMISRIFDGPAKERPKIAFQLFIYDMLLLSGKNAPAMEEMVNCMYPLPKIKTAGIAAARINPEFCHMAKERLAEIIKELSDPLIPFSRTEDRKTCEFCDFKTLCGR